MEEINLYDLLRYYAKNWLNLLIALMIGATIGLAYTYFVQTPMYKSSATLLMVGAQRANSADSVVLNNYVGLFTSQRVLGPVIYDQNYGGSYQDLAQNTQASNQKNTDIIEVSIATREPAKSKAMLESAIESFRQQARELYGTQAIDIKVVDAADRPHEAHNVKPLMQVGLAMAAAFAITVIGMFFTYDYRAGRSMSTGKPAAVEKFATANTKSESSAAQVGRKEQTGVISVHPGRNLWQRLADLLIGSDTTTPGAKKD